jgi:hypothetical protein
VGAEQLRDHGGALLDDEVTERHLLELRAGDGRGDGAAVRDVDPAILDAADHQRGRGDRAEAVGDVDALVELEVRVGPGRDRGRAHRDHALEHRLERGDRTGGEPVGDGVAHEQLGAGGDELPPQTEREALACVGGGPAAQRRAADHPVRRRGGDGQCGDGAERVARHVEPVDAEVVDDGERLGDEVVHLDRPVGHRRLARSGELDHHPAMRVDHLGAHHVPRGAAHRGAVEEQHGRALTLVREPDRCTSHLEDRHGGRR